MKHEQNLNKQNSITAANSKMKTDVQNGKR